MFNKIYKENEQKNLNYSIDTKISRENWIKNNNFAISKDNISKNEVLHYKTRILNNNDYSDLNNSDCAINLSVKLARIICEKITELIENYNFIISLSKDEEISKKIQSLKEIISIDLLTMQSIYSELSGTDLNKKSTLNSTLSNNYCFALRDALNKIENTTSLVIRLNKLLLIDNINRQLNIIKDNLYLASHQLMQMQINCFY